MKNLEIEGLNQKELEVYENLLTLKRATVLQLTQVSNEKRTTLYRILESLLFKGLVSEIYERKKHFYIAESPKKLLEFINNEKEKIKNILPDLEALEQQALERPKIKFCEGKEALKSFYNEIYAGRKEVRAVGAPERLVKDINFHNEQVAKRVRLKIPARVIYSDTPFSRKRAETEALREVRISKHLRPLDATFMFSSNKVMAFSHKNWVTGVLIENKEIASGLEAIFDALWEELENK
ncbi:MAG: helix-turn-helix domain-containing protein [Patescibacteria group bacterium]